MWKKIKKFLMLSGFAVAVMHLFNRYVSFVNSLHGKKEEPEDKYYETKNGKVYYRQQGEGSPVLLIHDIAHDTSSYEWYNNIDELSKDHTVYVLDLLGCGRSDKPNISYVAYLYVQQINSFIKDIIGKETDVITSGDSFAIAAFAKTVTNSLIRNIVAINPPKYHTANITPSSKEKLIHEVINMPVLGTFIYNVKNTAFFTNRKMSEKYYENKNNVSSKLMDSFYEMSHEADGNGKFLYASELTNYTDSDIMIALPKLTDASITIISNINTDYEEYKKTLPNIKLIDIDYGKKKPQMEYPEKINELILESIK